MKTPTTSARRGLVLGAACVATLVGLLAFGAQAQSWPTKPVRVVVPFPPGGASDTLARTVARKLGEQTNQTFVIENKPGAASTIGIAEAAKAPADGYTNLLAAAPFVITQYVYPKLSYDVRKDFVPLGLLQTTPLVLVAHPSLGRKTPADFLRAAKASPGKPGYATSPNVLARMSEQLAKALNSPDFRDKIAHTGDVPAGTQAEFADLLKGEHVRWERTVKAAYIQPN